MANIDSLVNSILSDPNRMTSEEQLTTLKQNCDSRNKQLVVLAMTWKLKQRSSAPFNEAEKNELQKAIEVTHSDIEIIMSDIKILEAKVEKEQRAKKLEELKKQAEEPKVDKVLALPTYRKDEEDTSVLEGE